MRGYRERLGPSCRKNLKDHNRRSLQLHAKTTRKTQLFAGDPDPGKLGAAEDEAREGILVINRDRRAQLDQPDVFGLLIVARCARRLCFFLASRASANLFPAFGEEACFSDFTWVLRVAFGSECSSGVELISFLLQS
jgi:hypothetical protein